MNMRIFLMAVACLYLSCNVNNKIKTLKYPVSNNGKKMILHIPKGYTFTHVGWESIYDGFQYKDSSLIYITDQYDAAVNNSNIKEAGLESKLFNAKMKNDTVTVTGVTKSGLYWRYTALGIYGVGYKNVRKENKEQFDQIINDAHVK